MNLSDSFMIRFTSLRLIMLAMMLSSSIRFAKMPDLEARRQRLLADLGPMPRRECQPRLAAWQQRHRVVREITRDVGGGGDEHCWLVGFEHQHRPCVRAFPARCHLRL